MKRTNLLLSFMLLLSTVVIGQESNDEFKPTGKAFGKVYWNYHFDATEDAGQKNNFQLQRAYLGYKYSFSESISANITLDGARVSGASDFTVFLKKAQLDWKVSDAVKLQMGLIGLKQFDTQEKFWGYRYLFKSFQDEFKLGSSADLGVNAEIKLAKTLKANVFLLNGEGYTSAQDDNGRMKLGGNLIYEPVKGLVLKGYYDIYGGDVEDISGEVVSDTVSVKTISFFAGYKADKFRVGAGFNLQNDGVKYNQVAADHDLFGYSLFGTYVINKQFEVFGYLLGYESNDPDGNGISWNSGKDGNIAIAGVQYQPVKGVSMALNYREYMYANADINGRYVYLNFEFKF